MSGHFAAGASGKPAPGCGIDAVADDLVVIHQEHT